MRPLVSVIMAVYNGQDFLQETIESLLSQKYKNIEIIIVDDCSTDKTWDILTSLKDERIILLRNDSNRRLAYSLNRAIQVAKGKYIARMDADDICLPNRIVLQVSYLEKHPDIDVLGGNYKAFGATNRKSDYQSRHGWIRTGLMFENTMCHPAVMFRKNSIKEWYDPSYAASQDFDLWTRLIDCNCFHNLRQEVIKYRVHEGQTVKKMTSQQNIGANKARMRMLEKTSFTETEMQAIIEFANTPLNLSKDEFVRYCDIIDLGIDKCNGFDLKAYKFYSSKCVWNNVINQQGSSDYCAIVKYAVVHYWRYLIKRPRMIYYVGKGVVKRCKEFGGFTTK